MGTGRRLLLLALAVVSITATTWGWQLLYANPNVSLLNAISVIIVPATVGVIAAYYGIRG
jgi:predicted Co/Zn/Cd cation transporter (cation efflux family)